MTDWQLVLVAWGTRYPVEEINHLIDAVRRHAALTPRVLLLSDRDRPGLAAGAECRAIPDFYLNPAFLGPGCLAKLCLFEPGVVPDDRPAVFLDLDTIVLGDVGRLAGLIDRPDRIAMLQSAILPFGAPGRLAFRLTGGRRYARGNSSVIVWNPAHGASVATAFRAALAAHPGIAGFRPLMADERFISWSQQMRMRSVPASLAVKLPTEFMWPADWIVHLRARLPWVARRRAGLVAITLPGAEVKAQALVALPEGARVTDRKGRRLIWSDAALGPVRRAILDYYAPLLGPGGGVRRS